MMKYTTLGNTDVQVSKICLGTMTWGEQNTEKEGHEQLDFALEKGVNFIDTAEMYSVPAKAETQGGTEKIIGTWLKGRQDRDKIVLATKAAGPQPFLTYLRDMPKFNKEQLVEALNGSLSRLQTDYIDLYQLHWPERKTNFFGKLGFKVEEDAWEDNIGEVMYVLDSFVKAGKVKNIGISNETPWGFMRFIEEGKKNDLSKVVSVQNPYSLLNRSYEVGMAEISYREKIGLLAYSPLAFGVLTGKYFGQEDLENARLTLFPRMKRYASEETQSAAKKYLALAQQHGLSLTQMALAFINQQPFLTSTIIGATNLKQLEENINSIDVELSEELLEGIEKIHQSIPNPAP